MMKILGVILLIIGGFILLKILLGLALAVGAMLWFLLKVGVAAALVVIGIRLIRRL